MGDTKFCHDDFNSKCTRKLKYEEKCVSFKNGTTEDGYCIYPCQNYSSNHCLKKIHQGFQVFRNFIFMNTSTNAFSDL